MCFHSQHLVIHYRDGVKVLWCHSHLVWVVFEDFIPTCACFHSENFLWLVSVAFFLDCSSITTPQVERNGDWNAGGSYTPSANHRVQVEGHLVLHITDGVCVCVAVTTLAQSSSLPKSTCRVVLNVHVGMLIGDRSQLPAGHTKLISCFWCSVGVNFLWLT